MSDKPTVYWLVPDDGLFSDQCYRERSSNKVALIRVDELPKLANLVRKWYPERMSWEEILKKIGKKITEPEWCLLKKGDIFENKKTGRRWVAISANMDAVVLEPEAYRGTIVQIATNAQLARINPDGTTTPVRGWADEDAQV